MNRTPSGEHTVGIRSTETALLLRTFFKIAITFLMDHQNLDSPRTGSRAEITAGIADNLVAVCPISKLERSQARNSKSRQPLPGFTIARLGNPCHDPPRQTVTSLYPSACNSPRAFDGTP